MGLFEKKLHFYNHEHLGMVLTNLFASIMGKSSEQTLDINLASFYYRTVILGKAPLSNDCKISRGQVHGYKPNELFQDNLVSHEIERDVLRASVIMLYSQPMSRPRDSTRSRASARDDACTILMLLLFFGRILQGLVRF